MSSEQSSEVLDRLLDPVAECLTPEVARALVNLRARPEIQARIDELAGKCNEGNLSPIEQAEYREIVEAIDFISILQAKARKRFPRPSDR
jgi:acyl-CoA reductase-like NAD-dependent aldehyde dehydrogenase